MENSFKILPLGLYVHYPFCIRKCPYCDFNSYGEGSDSDRDILYFRRLKTDFSKALEEQNLKGRRFKSVYIGGGTPSLADTDLISEFLNFISGSLDSSVEISMECNPGTVDLNKLKAIKAAGVNRLSIGVQSFNSASLKRLGRIHDAESAKNAVESAVKAGFTYLNVDLMHGLPNQTASEALSDLKQALEQMFFSGALVEKEEVYLTNLRQKEALAEADESLEHVKDAIRNTVSEDFYVSDLMDAYEALGRITGEAIEDDLADKIFSAFCLGK